MSRVATAQGQASQTSPNPLREFWKLTLSGSSLTGKLSTLQILAQLPVQVSANVNRLSGNIWALDDKNVYGMLRGLTVMTDAEQQQTVSFDILVNGELYNFSGGVLSPDRMRIDGGLIEKNLPDTDPTSIAEDGSWSAQAQTGPPTEESVRGKWRGRTDPHRR